MKKTTPARQPMTRPRATRGLTFVVLACALGCNKPRSAPASESAASNSAPGSAVGARALAELRQPTNDCYFDGMHVREARSSRGAMGHTRETSSTFSGV